MKNEVANLKQSDKTTQDYADSSCETAGRQTRVLIVNRGFTAFNSLASLIESEPGFTVCASRYEPDGVSAFVCDNGIDFAIVAIKSECGFVDAVVEEIRLKCPGLSVLILSAGGGMKGVEGLLKQCIGKQTGEKIIMAANYIRFLLSSKIFGFTVFVSV